MSGWIPSALSTALAAALLLGMTCGLLGTFVVVRRMALTGDMLSHAVLPGIVLGLSWSATRNPWIVLACAVAAGLLGTGVLNALLARTKLKPDAALALVLSVFFAIGIAMISRLQPPGVHAFLYGQIAAIDRGDLTLLAGVSLFSLLLVPLSFRTLGFVSFDPAFARLSGLPVRWIEAGFFLLLTLVIVIAMQAVGVVLVTAMLVTPPAAARFCTSSLAKTALLSCLIGALGGAAGAFVSSLRGGLPTGPVMALAVTAVFAAAALFGPRSGWLPSFLRKRGQQLRILGEDILKTLWQHEEARGINSSLSAGELAASFPGRLSAVLRELSANGLLSSENHGFRLTPEGRRRATRLVRSHRLWERYLTERAAYKPDHVHDSAERVEHWIDEAGRRRLEQRLGHPTEDPHGSPIPPADEKEKEERA